MDYANKFVFDLMFEQFGAGSKYKWKTFVHSGVAFPPPYQPHNTPLIYDGQRIHLKPDSEEYASIYAKFIETEYVKNSVFNKNFFSDWKKILKKDSHVEIQSFELCDFREIYEHLVKMKEDKKSMSEEQKLLLKESKELEESKYLIAYVDDKPQPVGNFRMEPPGIFLGRGCHPKAGKIKKRVFPKDIIINISKGAPIPPIPEIYSNQKWKKVIHDRNAEWLASWKDNITGKTKYVWLGAKSDFKAKSDEQKFDQARKLNKRIVDIRRTNMMNITDESADADMKVKQMACALHLIDNLALRVGNEKSEDEADTVGVCSLRVEHVKLIEPDTVELDFLGKDSVRYQNSVHVDKEVFKVLRYFTDGKDGDDELFDLINPQMLNQYLKSMMDGLTAKVFRTFNASKLFQSELDKIGRGAKLDVNVLLDLYNKANLKVAILCNHQKNVSKSFDNQIKSIDERIAVTKKKIKELGSNSEKIKRLKAQLKDLGNKRSMKMELKNLSLTTSKTNYIDPRITIAFLKKHSIPLEKIFSQTLRDKFFWAMDVSENWHF